MLYKVAYASGIRCGELSELTIASLRLDGTSPLIIVETAHSKSCNREEQPIPTWLALELRTWLNKRKSVRIGMRGPTKLWPGSWDGRAAEMLREDLEAAEVPYVD
jgi:hypothetical protein